jgi:hypothetical protein
VKPSLKRKEKERKKKKRVYFGPHFWSMVKRPHLIMAFLLTESQGSARYHTAGDLAKLALQQTQSPEDPSLH